MCAEVTKTACQHGLSMFLRVYFKRQTNPTGLKSLFSLARFHMIGFIRLGVRHNMASFSSTRRALFRNWHAKAGGGGNLARLAHV